jgi:cytochrome P450
MAVHKPATADRAALPPRAPGSLAGILRALREDPLGFLSATQRQHGDVVGFRLFLWRVVLVSHPDGVRQVLQERHSAYSKDNVDYRMLKPVLGEGLVTSDGALWRRQRRLMQPAFHRERIAALGGLMTARTERMLERWAPAVARGEVVDVAAEMSRLALDIVSRALFRVDVAGLADRISAAVTTLNHHVSRRFESPIGLLLAGLPPLLPQARRALRTLDEVVLGIIREQRRGGGDGGLVSTLLELRDEATGEGMTDRQLRDEVMTLMLAGHETTANALAWTWYLLARHPVVAERLRAELARVLGGRPPSVADLPRLGYTRMVIDEVMRLYPPAWLISRKAKEEDVIGGYRIPAGATVALSPWVTHRHPECWDAPDAFDPERFTSERAAHRPRFAYFPFGGGPRLCIGNTFALTEAQLVLATVAQRYRLELLPGWEPTPEPLVTLRPRGGLPMRIVEGQR